jgi:hydrogenase nickel incorporation protein HypA/HybF
MHEMSVCESVLQILEQQAPVQNYQKVKVVWLEVGALAGVDINSLRFSFDAVMKNSIADQAKLEIIEINAQAWCFVCAQTVKVEQRYDVCPHCGTAQLQINTGDQLRIRELAVE